MPTCEVTSKTAIAAAAHVADGQPLSDDTAARLACALTDPLVRDTLYALAVGEDAGAGRVVVG